MSKSNVSDLELVTFNYIRTEHEIKYKQNVPKVLKYLILKFSKKIIGCKLLTNKQDLDLYKLISSKLPSIRRFSLLFRASDHKYSAAKFHEHCDYKGPTISIIKSNFGNIFGGYTSKSWTSENRQKRDENAFLFLVASDDQKLRNKCPLLLELNKKYVRRAILAHSAFGPTFGAGSDIVIYDNCNKKIEKEELNWRHLSQAHMCSYPHAEVKSICGGDVVIPNRPKVHLFQVMEYEVFQVL